MWPWHQVLATVPITQEILDDLNRQLAAWKPRHKRKRWTKERRATLVALAVAGLSRQHIAVALGVSPHAISCEMSRLGLTCKILAQAGS